MTVVSPAHEATFFPLLHLGVLAVDGVDANTFLQGQATCDCRQVDATRGALGALCNLQGRMIASFYVLAMDGGLRLLMPRDRVAAMLTHLKKYAVFSKVTLRDDSDAGVLSACVDDNSAAEPFSAMREENGGTVTLHLRGRRALRWQAGAPDSPVANAAAHSDPVFLFAGTSTASATAGEIAWRAASIRAGELLVDTASADAFLPQALNYDVIDGVNFRKGCYTGQEVVARMHFKGKMKERLQLFSGSGAMPLPGSSLQDEAGHEVGRVVDAVAEGDGYLIAAVIRHDALALGAVLTGSKDTVRRMTPPYAVPDSPPA